MPAPLAAWPGFEGCVATLLLEPFEPLARLVFALVGQVGDTPMGIDADAVTHRAAEQLIDGDAMHLSGDIP